MGVHTDAGHLARRALTYRLFAQALDQPADARAHFLDARCLGDAALRGDIDALIGIAEIDEVAREAYRTLRDLYLTAGRSADAQRLTAKLEQ